MPTTPQMGMVLPTDHSDADVWGAILNTALTLNDLHDHTTGKGVQVPSAALKINADVAWNFAGTFYALTGVKALDFEPRAASEMTGYASALFANSSDSNNLYFRNQAGTNVKITDGSTLNISIVGGIGGDYTSIGALVDYDDASDTYRFRQETAASVRQFAKMKHADIHLVEYDASGDASVPANHVVIKSPDTLAATYDLTLLAALPGSTVLLQVSSAGQVTASNSLATNAHLTLSGTGEVKHGDRVIHLNGCAAVASDADVVRTATTGRIGSTAATDIMFGIPLLLGDRIKSVTVELRGDGAADVTTFDVVKVGAAQAITSLGSTSITNPSATWTDTTVDVTDTIVGAGESFFVRLAINATGIDVANCRITYDRP